MKTIIPIVCCFLYLFSACGEPIVESEKNSTVASTLKDVSGLSKCNTQYDTCLDNCNNIPHGIFASMIEGSRYVLCNTNCTRKFLFCQK